MHRLFQPSPLDSPPVNWRRECLVILPALDEARHLPALIHRVRAFLPEVLVVDDASTDRTREVALAANATVIRNATRQGKGASLGMRFPARTLRVRVNASLSTHATNA